MNPQQKTVEVVAERDRRRAIVTRLLVARASVPEIIAALAKQSPPIIVSRGTVYYDIKKVQARWLQEQGTNLDTIRARELAELDHIENELALAWSKSGGRSETITYDKDGNIKRRVVKVEEPNPNFLRLRLEAKKQRAALLGLGATDVSLNLLLSSVTDNLRKATDEELAMIVANGPDQSTLDPEVDDAELVEVTDDGDDDDDWYDGGWDKAGHHTGQG